MLAVHNKEIKQQNPYSGTDLKNVDSVRPSHISTSKSEESVSVEMEENLELYNSEL